MTSRPDLDVNAIDSQDVGGAVDVRRAVEPEAHMMKAAGTALHESHVMRSATSLEKSGELMSLAAHHLLRQAEAEHLAEEA